MATFEATPVDAAIVAHRLAHAADALSKIDSSLIAALSATANILRGAGASSDEIKDATIAFSPLVKLVADSKKLVAGITDCNCQQEETARQLDDVKSRAAANIGKVIDLGMRRRNPPRDLIDVGAKYDSEKK